MRFKAILLDLDDTLYDYDYSHKIALNELYSFVYQDGLDIELFKSNLSKARDAIHKELINSASMHNRLLYFQRACELMGIDIFKAYGMYEIYWSAFLDSMKLKDGALEFLRYLKSTTKICIVTDLLAEIQYKKILKLGIDSFISSLVTSEEAGVEKPHPYIFLLSLFKLKAAPNEACMIGDDYKKDILGASSIGIEAIWITDSKDSFNAKKVSNFYELLELFR